MEVGFEEKLIRRAQKQNREDRKRREVRNKKRLQQRKRREQIHEASIMQMNKSN